MIALIDIFTHGGHEAEAIAIIFTAGCVAGAVIFVCRQRRDPDPFPWIFMVPACVFSGAVWLAWACLIALTIYVLRSNGVMA